MYAVIWTEPGRNRTEEFANLPAAQNRAKQLAAMAGVAHVGVYEKIYQYNIQLVTEQRIVNGQPMPSPGAK